MLQHYAKTSTEPITIFMHMFSTLLRAHANMSSHTDRYSRSLQDRVDHENSTSRSPVFQELGSAFPWPNLSCKVLGYLSVSLGMFAWARTTAKYVCVVWATGCNNRNLVIVIFILHWGMVCAAEASTLSTCKCTIQPKLLTSASLRMTSFGTIAANHIQEIFWRWSCSHMDRSPLVANQLESPLLGWQVVAQPCLNLVICP